MTTRERKERKAERRRAWAESRRRQAAVARAGASAIADGIPFGQPILVGHHSEAHARRDQDRIHAGFRAGHEHDQMAQHHEDQAVGIEQQLDSSIYSDDVDAHERLRERIARLEAERDRVKAYNASCRKGARDLSVLDEGQQGNLLSVARHCPYQLGKRGEFPGYHLTNLGARIRTDKKRLAALGEARTSAERTSAERAYARRTCTGRT